VVTDLPNVKNGALVIGGNMQNSTQIRSGRKVLVAAILGSLLGAASGGVGAGYYLMQKSEKQQRDWMDSVAAMNSRVDRLASALEHYRDKQDVLRTGGVKAERVAGGTLTDSQLDAAIKDVFDSAGLPADEAMSGVSEPARIEDSAPAEQQGEQTTEQKEAYLRAYHQALKDKVITREQAPAEDQTRSEVNVEAPAAKG
jgi:hypothetical protein